MKVQQNKAVQALFNINKRTRLQPYYRKANILTIESLIDLSLLKIIYRYVNNILSKRIVNLFEIPTHNYATRNRIGLQAPQHTLQIYSNSFLARSPHLWLHLPINIISNYLLNVLSSTNVIN